MNIIRGALGVQKQGIFDHKKLIFWRTPLPHYFFGRSFGTMFGQGARNQPNNCRAMRQMIYLWIWWRWSQAQGGCISQCMLRLTPVSWALLQGSYTQTSKDKKQARALKDRGLKRLGGVPPRAQGRCEQVRRRGSCCNGVLVSPETLKLKPNWRNPTGAPLMFVMLLLFLTFGGVAIFVVPCSTPAGSPLSRLQSHLDSPASQTFYISFLFV